MKGLFHVKQPLGLVAGKLKQGHAGPHADDVGDVFLGDLGLGLALDRLPFLFHLAAFFSDLVFALAELGGVVVLLGGQGGFLVAAVGILGLFQIFQRHRLGAEADTDPGGGFVDDVDGLVRHEAVGNIAGGEVGGGGQGVIGDLQAMMLLIAAADAFQDLYGVFERRLLDQHGLEAAFEGGVALDVLAVVVQGGGADDLDLAAG